MTEARKRADDIWKTIMSAVAWGDGFPGAYDAVLKVCEDLEELEAWKAGKKGIEEYYMLREELWKAQAEIRKLKNE